MSVKFSRALARDPSLTGRYVKKYESDIIRLIDKVKKEIKALLEQELQEQKELAVWRIDIKRFKDTVTNIIQAEYKNEAEPVANKAIEGQVQRGIMRSDQFLGQLGISAGLGVPVDRQVLDILQARNLTEIMGIGDDLERRIITAVSEGVTNGDGIRAITKRITESTDVSKSKAKMVARTETMNAFNKASEERYKKHGIAEVKWKTGGSNICTHVKGFDGSVYSGGCMGLNNEIFPIDNHPPQPLHPNCKCILQPVIEKVKR
jgi:SPP1 gp7 family putative phage head morphogenesis protein